MRWMARAAVCPLCGEAKDGPEAVCVACRLKIENFQQSNPLFTGDFRLYRAASYREFRRVHLRFKYGGQTQLAPVAAMIMLQAYLANLSGENEMADLITYIPSTRVRMGQRGYNTAELLAKWLGRYMDKPVRGLLKRKNGPKQTGLENKRRVENVRGIFSVSRYQHARCIKMEVSNILLVDDVWTSGATMTEAVNTLSNHGYVNVAGICFLARR